MRAGVRQGNLGTRRASKGSYARSFKSSHLRNRAYFFPAIGVLSGIEESRIGDASPDFLSPGMNSLLPTDSILQCNPHHEPISRSQEVSNYPSNECFFRLRRSMVLR